MHYEGGFPVSILRQCNRLAEGSRPESCLASCDGMSKVEIWDKVVPQPKRFG